MEESNEVLICLHLQEGYGHGTAEEEIVEYLESFEGSVVGLTESGQGDIYGEEQDYDCIIRGGETAGKLYNEVKELFETSFDKYRVIGLYGSECIPNLVDSLGTEDVLVDSEAVIDQDFANGNYIVSERLRPGAVRHILEYGQDFLNSEILDRFTLPPHDKPIGELVEDSLESDDLDEIESMTVEQATNPSNTTPQVGGFDNPPGKKSARARVT
jgi:hypothetical protein